MRHRPPRGSRRQESLRHDSQRDAPLRTAAERIDTDAALDERAVAAARAELRGERTGILGATGRLSLPRLNPPRRIPERWTFVVVMDRLEEAFRTLRRLPIATRPRGYVNPGGGNFTVPDLRGRFFFNLDAGGSGRITSAGGNFDGTVLGNVGGQQSRTIAQANLPNVNFNVSSPTLTTTITFIDTLIDGSGFVKSSGPASGGNTFLMRVGSTSGATAPTSLISEGASAQTAASGGFGAALATLPPSMGVNCMMRIA